MNRILSVPSISSFVCKRITSILRKRTGFLLCTISQICRVVFYILKFIMQTVNKIIELIL